METESYQVAEEDRKSEIVWGVWDRDAKCS